MYGVSTDRDPVYTKRAILDVLEEYHDRLWAGEDVSELTNTVMEMVFSAKSPEPEEMKDILRQSISMRIEPVSRSLIARGVEPDEWHLRSAAVTGQPNIVEAICNKGVVVPRGLQSEIQEMAAKISSDEQRKQYAEVVEKLKMAQKKESFGHYFARRAKTAFKGRE